MSEVAFVGGIAKATLPPNPKVKWVDWVSDYGQIRDLIAETYPDQFPISTRACGRQAASVARKLGARADLEDREQQGQVREPGISVRDRFRRRSRPSPPHHDAQQRPVQHDDLRLQRPHARHRGHLRRAAHQSGRHAAGEPERRADRVAPERCRGRGGAASRRAESHALLAAGRMRRRLLSGDESADAALASRRAFENARKVTRHAESVALTEAQKALPSAQGKR